MLLYTLNTLNGVSGNYCVTFDGSSNVQFYSVGTATSSSSLPGSPTTLNIAQTLLGDGTTDSYGVCGNAIFKMPYGGPGGLAPTFTSDPAQPMKVTIWNIPTYSRATPTATATPLPCPT